MVAPRGWRGQSPVQDARLLPRRGRAGPPLLAVPRGPVRPRGRRPSPQLVAARGVRMNAPTPYAELDAMSNFSFLEGGSHPGELVEQAKALGLSAIGVADRNTLAGVVRAHAAAKLHGMRLLIGCPLTFLDGAELIFYPRDRAAYGRLCRLLSIGKSGINPSPLAGEGGARERSEWEDEGAHRPLQEV